jgi:uncharacterized membrane protein YhaH (DUF805 family)
MSILRLFFSFKGRITRSQFWLGMFVSTLVVFAVYGSVASTILSLIKRGDPSPVEVISALGKLILPIFLGTITNIWMCAAIYTKRLHDRGKSAIWLLAVYIPAFLPTFMLFYAPDAFMATGVLVWISWLWIVIELGCLPGTPGPNRFDSGTETAYLDDTFGQAPNQSRKTGPNSGNGYGGMEAAMAAVTAAAREERRLVPRQPGPATPEQIRQRAAPAFGQLAPPQFGRLNAGGTSGGFGRKI